MTVTGEGLYQLLNWGLLMDEAVYTWVHTAQVPWLVILLQTITHLGFLGTYVSITVVVSGFLLYRRRILEAVFLNVSLVSAWSLMVILKNVFERSRPVGDALTAAAGYSFPSGHALLSMAFYGFLACLWLSYNHSWGARLGAIGFFILVFLIGFSRIYLNVHYLSDVLVGFVLGMVCLALSWKVMQIMKRRTDCD